MAKNSIIINLPKDLGDNMLCAPAILAVQEHCDKNDMALVTVGSKLRHSWAQELTGAALPHQDLSQIQGQFALVAAPPPSMIVNLNFYDALDDKLAGLPVYAPEKLVTLEQDEQIKGFGAGAVIGKKHVGLLLEDCLKDAGIIGAQDRLPLPKLPDSYLTDDAVSNVKDKFGLKDDYVVLIPVCAANRPLKRWEENKFVVIAQEMHAKGLQCVLVGGPSKEETALCAKIRDAANTGITDICGKTSLSDIASLAKGARATLGCDTGPSHIAAVSGAPVAMLFGYYNDPATWNARTPHNTACAITGPKIQQIPVGDALAWLDAVVKAPAVTAQPAAPRIGRD
jgi:Glycosyltransferase family 9 (heptosyltransferase)